HSWLSFSPSSLSLRTMPAETLRHGTTPHRMGSRPTGAPPSATPQHPKIDRGPRYVKPLPLGERAVLPPGKPRSSRPGALRSWTAAQRWSDAMTILMLVLGILLGAVVAALLARPARDRTREAMREEMKALTLDLMTQTGATLAQTVAESRGADHERAAGEMALRTEEIKGLVAPVQEKLGRMESEIGRLERERRQAQGELAQMLRQLGEGVGTLRRETGNLVTALKRPATRGSWGEIQLRNVVEMAGMVSHCDFVEQS